MPGPSLSGPLTGWTSATLAPKTANSAVPRSFLDQFAYNSRGNPKPLSTDPAERKKQIAEEEKIAAASGDPQDYKRALNTLFSDATAGILNPKINRAPNIAEQTKLLIAKRDALKGFMARHPEYQPPARLQAWASATDDNIWQADQNAFAQDATAAVSPQASLTAQLLANPPAPQAPAGASAVSGGPSAYDLTSADFGDSGPNPRTATQPQTPLESLLAAIYPDANIAPDQSLVDPRTGGQAPSAFQNILANLGQRGSATGGQSGYVPAPSLIGPNVAATIPGAPAFLGGAINTLQGFNQPAPVVGGSPAGPDFSGLAQLSAEQRIQKAELDKNLAAANAAWFKSQHDQETKAAQQANLQRLKGGWTSPAMPRF